MFFIFTDPIPIQPLDIVIAVDSSACFRDQLSRMTRWLTKLVKGISRSHELEFGNAKVRLSLMLVSERGFSFKTDTDTAKVLLLLRSFTPLGCVVLND